MAQIGANLLYHNLMTQDARERKSQIKYKHLGLMPIAYVNSCSCFFDLLEMTTLV